MPRTAEERKRANAAAAARSRAKKNARIAELEAELSKAQSLIQHLKGALKFQEAQSKAFADGVASVKKTGGWIGSAIDKAKERLG